MKGKKKMFIDIHGHTVIENTIPYPGGGERFTLPEDLIKRYDEIGIEKAVMLPITTVENVPVPQSNEEILRIAQLFPGRFIPFCNTDPRSCGNHWRADLEYVLKYYRDKGCRGVGEVVANINMMDPRMQNLFKAAEAAGLPLTFHLAPCEGGFYGIVADAGLIQLEESLRRFPKLNFFGHSQTFWAEIAANPSYDDRCGYPKGAVTEEGAVPKLMRQYPNLLGDLSAGSGFNAIARDKEYGIRFLNEFQDRLFFGTDICAPGTEVPLAPYLKQLKQEGSLSETVFRKIARENALRILGV